MIAGILFLITFLYFAFEIAIGMWLLKFFFKEDVRVLRVLGGAFGWLIIVLAFFFMIYTSIAIVRFAANPQAGCPMYKMMQSNGNKQAPGSQFPCPYRPQAK